MTTTSPAPDLGRSTSASPTSRHGQSQGSATSQLHSSQQLSVLDLLDWINTKLVFFNPAAGDDTDDPDCPPPLRLTECTALPPAGTVTEEEHEDIDDLGASASKLFRAFTKWIVSSSGGNDLDHPEAGDEDGMPDLSKWPSTMDNDPESPALVRMRKRAIGPFAGSLRAVDPGLNENSPVSDMTISGYVRRLLLAMDLKGKPGVVRAVQLAFAVMLVFEHDSKSTFQLTGAQLLSLVRMLLFDMTPAPVSAHVDESGERLTREVRVVLLAVRVAIMLAALAVHSGVSVDQVESEFGEAFAAICGAFWHDLVAQLRHIEAQSKGSPVRLPVIVTDSLRHVIADQVFNNMDLSGGARSSHTSTTSTASLGRSPPRRLTVSTARTSPDLSTNSAASISRPDTANTASSAETGDTTPKAAAHPQGFASDENGHDDDDNDEGDLPETLGVFHVSELPTQQMRDMQDAMQLGLILAPGESQFARYADPRSFMPPREFVDVSDDEIDEVEEDLGHREPTVQADIDALYDEQDGSEQDEPSTDEEALRQVFRSYDALLGMDVEDNGMPQRPKRARQDSSPSESGPRAPTHQPELDDQDGEYGEGDEDLVTPPSKRRRIQTSPRLELSEQTRRRRATGGRLLDSQCSQSSPRRVAHMSARPPAVDELTVDAASTTARLADPPLPSPPRTRSRQRAAAAAMAANEDDRMDTDAGDRGEDEDEDEDDEIQDDDNGQEDQPTPAFRRRRPGPNRLLNFGIRPRAGARIGSDGDAASDSDTEQAPLRPADAVGIRRMGPLRHPPPPAPQPEPEPERDAPEPEPEPEPEQEPRRAPARARAAPAAAARRAAHVPGPEAQLDEGERPVRPRRPARRWTEEEEAALERAMNEYEGPPSWSDILKRHGQPGGPLARFNQVQLKDKARNVKTKRRKYGLPLGVFEYATDYPTGL